VIFGASPLSDPASSGSPGGITYKSSNTNVATVSGAGGISFFEVGSATITATQAAVHGYLAATKTAVVKVSAIAPKLTFTTASVTAVFGAAQLSNPASSSGSPGGITYKSSNTNVATVSGIGDITFVGVGTSVITATQAAVNGYLAATKLVAVKVKAAKPTIGVLTLPVSPSVGASNFTITSPTSPSTGGFTFKSSDTKIATIKGNVIAFVKAGITTITATQAAKGNYLSGAVSSQLTVTN
jgi:hypothetical protein